MYIYIYIYTLTTHAPKRTMSVLNPLVAAMHTRAPKTVPRPAM